MEEYKSQLSELLDAPVVEFGTGGTTELPRSGGVYRISERSAGAMRTIYVGKSKNLKRRIHGDHLLGDRVTSTLKRKLIRETSCENEADVKQYLKDKCVVQFVEIDDVAARTGFEHFAVAILRPAFND
jgi:hypothetical protein